MALRKEDEEMMAAVASVRMSMSDDGQLDEERREASAACPCCSLTGQEVCCTGGCMGPALGGAWATRAG